MLLVVKDGVGGFHHRCIRARVLAGVEVAVEPREVAAADFYADLVPFEEDIAGGPEIDLVLINLAGDDGTGRAHRFAIAGAQNAFSQVCLLYTSRCV